MTLIASDGSVLSIDDGDTFQKLLAVQRRELALLRPITDSTSLDNDHWAEQSSRAQLIRAELRVEGAYFRGVATDVLRSSSLSGKAATYRLDIPGDGVWQGPFLVASLIYRGVSEGEEAISLRLASTGLITFTATN